MDAMRTRTAATFLRRGCDPEAMPVILTTDEERDVWRERLGMRQKRCSGPLRDDALKIVARGAEKEDRAAA